MKIRKMGQWLTAAALAAGLALPAAAADIKVGVMTAMTGAYAFGGVPIRNGMVLALKEANDTGYLPGTKIQILDADSGGEKGQAITLASRFAKTDNVLMILGPMTSLEATAAAPIANEQKVVLFSTSASKGITAAGPYSFKMQPVGSDNMGPLAEYAVNKLGVKKVALVFDRGNDGYVGQKDGIKAAFEKAGVKIVNEDGILATDTDFLALATKLATSDADAFFVTSPAEVGANLLLQARQAGLPAKVRMLAPSTFASDSFLDIAGKAATGSIISADYFIGDPSPANQAFVKAYAAAYGQQPDNWAAVGYALAKVALTAVKNAGADPTREKVMQELTKLRDQPSILGNHVWTMDDQRNPSYGAALLEVRNGKFELAP